MADFFGPGWGQQLANLIPSYRDMQSQIAATQHQQLINQEISQYEIPLAAIKLNVERQRQALLQHYAQQESQAPGQPPTTPQDQMLQDLARQEAYAKDMFSIDPKQASELMERNALTRAAVARGDATQEAAKDRNFEANLRALALDHRLDEDTKRDIRDNMELQRRLDKDAFERRRDIARLQFKESRSELAKQHADERAGKQATQSKTGVVTMPSKDLQAQAYTLIQKSFAEEPLPEDEMGEAAFQVSSRAMELVKQNRGLGPGEALKRAFVEMQPQFKRISNAYRELGIPVGAGREFTGKALPLPASKSVKDLVPGQYYTDGKTTQKWTGSGWEAASDAEEVNQ